VALAPCRECGEQISASAQSCPHCGVPYPVSSKVSAGCAKWAGIGCLALLVVFVLAIVSTNTGKNSPPAIDHPTAGLAHLAQRKLIVWRSKADYDEGIKLLVAGVGSSHPELLLPHAKCLPDGGESVTILDSGFDWREVLVETGNPRGCRGFVERENVVP
jgi:hypothetical protein